MKLMKSVVAGAFVALAGSVVAATYSKDGYTWTYTTANSEVEITDVSPKPTGDVDIPPSIGYKSVTRIGDFVFYGCTGLKFIVLPNGLKEIGAGAFRGCTALEEINMHMPTGVTKIEENAFTGCTSLKRVDLPMSVTHLGTHAFANCTGLEFASLPSKFAKTTGDLLNSWFYGCPNQMKFYFLFQIGVYSGEPFYLGYTVLDAANVQIGLGMDGYSAIRTDIPETALKPLRLPDMIEGRKVTRIGDYAFATSKIESLVVSDGLEYIGMGAFNECESLRRVKLPATVKALGSGAFANCTSLMSARLPIKLYGKIDRNDIFYNCPENLRFSYVAKSGEKSYLLRDVADGHATLEGIDPDPTGNLSIISKIAGFKITAVDDYAFQECEEITAVKFSSSVESIGEAAFRDCTSLTSAAIPKSVTSIGENAFDNCPLNTVIVQKGDTDRVKALLAASGVNVAGLTFEEVAGSNDDEYDVDPGSIDPFNPGDLPCYTVLDPASIWDPIKVTKATSLFGAVYYGCDIVGVVELKIGKPKKSETKLSGSVTLNTGKKYTIKSQKFNFGGQYAGTPNLTVNKLGSLRIALGSIDGRNVFSGSLGSYHVQTASVGGNWTRTDASATVSVGDLSVIPGMVVTDLLPSSEPVTPSRGKWAFKKAASVKWTKVKAGVTPLILQPATGKGLVVDMAKGKTNLSALKLTYTPKSGIFKGSFKVYALQGSGAAMKLKKYTVKVTGFVVDGVGDGKATCKTPAISWKITVD